VSHDSVGYPMHEQAPALDNLACHCEAPQGAVAIHLKRDVQRTSLFSFLFNVYFSELFFSEYSAQTSVAKYLSLRQWSKHFLQIERRTDYQRRKSSESA
jgi:hypothetical protein